MKKLYLFLYLLVHCLLLSSLPGQAASLADSEVVVVRLYETGVTDAMIVVSYGSGKVQSIPVGNPHSTRNYVPNAEKLQGVIERLLQEGYVLQAASGGGTNNTLVTTFIFYKNIPPSTSTPATP